MKRFILTSSQFIGKVEAIYDMNGKLQKIDFAGAELSVEFIKAFKIRITLLAANMYEAFKETGITVTEAEFEVSFEDFKREYPYKRNTHLAQKQWALMTSGEQYKAFVEAMNYRKFLAKQTWKQNPKLPEKWLKDKEYLNDYTKL
jgi:hypothetical protein